MREDVSAFRARSMEEMQEKRFAAFRDAGGDPEKFWDDWHETSVLGMIMELRVQSKSYWA